MNSLTRQLCAAVLSMAILAGSGCSTFNYDWNKSVAGPANAPAPTGAWDGYWLSDHNGHTGRLRCRLAENPDGTYQARFRAVYAKYIQVGYTATFRLEPAVAGEIHFRGGADLGWWRGGIYGYEGRIGVTNFFSTYTSKYDHGTFQLHRAQDTK